MSSVIEMVVLSEHGERISFTRTTIEYGDEFQRVVVILADPDADVSSTRLTGRDALDESFADHLAQVDGYDA